MVAATASSRRRLPFAAAFLLSFLLIAGCCAGGGRDAEKHCDAAATEKLSERILLEPSDLPPPFLFDDFLPKVTFEIPNFVDNDATTINATLLPGSIRQQGSGGHESAFAVLPAMVPRAVVSEILQLVRGSEDPDVSKGSVTFRLDDVYDSVDGMTSQELYLDKGAIDEEETELQKALLMANATAGLDRNKFDDHVEGLRRRTLVRTKLNELLEPHTSRITRLLQTYLPACRKGHGRNCTPCKSLLRRYRQGERQSHAPHIDSLSYVTVVVSLSDYETEYLGGLYISTSTSQKKFLPLNRGDAVLHQSDLYHGVHVLDNRSDGKPAERWSYILWYRDSESCEDHSAEWFDECSMEANPTCMWIKSKTASKSMTPQETFRWVQKAAKEGHSQAMVKIGYAYLGVLQTSELETDWDKAAEMFRQAVELSNDPEGHYALASLYLAKTKMDILEQPTKTQQQRRAYEIMMAAAESSPNQSKSLVRDAIYHLEEAANCGHFFAMFNLGMAAWFGYGTTDQKLQTRNYELALRWFEASGLPEGLAVIGNYKKLLEGDLQGAEDYQKRAALLGYGQPWRKEKRATGDFPGVQLNLHWPPIYPTGETPPEW